MPSEAPSSAVDSFITRWANSGGAERANYQLFLADLCTLLEVPPPDPTKDDDSHNAYVFERAVRFDNRDGTHSTGRIDAKYRKGRGALKPERRHSRAREGTGLHHS